MSKALLAQFLGRGNTFSISRTLYRLTGDLAAAYFLGECVFWSDWAEREGKTDLHRAGWFHRTHEEWEAETGLGADVVKRVKGVCLNYGLRYEKKGVPGKGHYRVDGAHLLELLGMIAEGADLADVRAHGAVLYAEYLAGTGEAPSRRRVTPAPVGGNPPNLSEGGAPLSSEGQSLQLEGGKASNLSGGTPPTSATGTPPTSNSSNTTPTQLPQQQEKTPPNPPEGGTEGAGETPAQEAGQKQATTPVTAPIDQGQGTQEKQGDGHGKGSGRGAARGGRARREAAEIPEADAWAILNAYNAHAGTLPKVDPDTGLNEGRLKACAAILRNCGGDLARAVTLVADAAQCVAGDEWWTAKRSWGFDSLAPKVQGKAEAWRAIQAEKEANGGQLPAQTPAPSPYTGRPRSTAEANAQAADKARSMAERLRNRQ